MKNHLKHYLGIAVIALYMVSSISCTTSADPEATSDCGQMRSECTQLFNSVKPLVSKMIQEEKSKQDGEEVKDPTMAELGDMLGKIDEIERLDKLTKKMQEQGCQAESDEFTQEMVLWIAMEYGK
ncbi:MAG: hypothetical protein ACKOA1_10640 [Bacteroidota bacterium]